MPTKTKAIKAATPATKAAKTAPAFALTHTTPKRATAAKPATTTKAVKPKPATIKAAPAPVLTHSHAANGVHDKTNNLSSFLNANRKPRVAIDGAHKFTRTPAQLTDRTKACLYAIRKAYDAKPFPARGLDNAILAMLTSAKIISPVSNTGQRVTDNGIEFLSDGEKPALFKLTKAGHTFGRVTA